MEGKTPDWLSCRAAAM